MEMTENVSKSAVMIFSKDAVNGCWKWGEYNLPIVSSYSYLGIDFSRNGAWDKHIRKLLDNGKKRVNQLHKVISNRNINLTARRHLLLLLHKNLQIAQENNVINMLHSTYIKLPNVFLLCSELEKGYQHTVQGLLFHNLLCGYLA